MKRIGGWRSAARRSFAMLVCLVLSAATPDLNCIQATVNLEDAGYLDIEKLAKAKASDIARYIRVAGIHVRRAQYLIKLAGDIQERHNGILPADEDSIQKLLGVGEKTTALMMNEAFGFNHGIGVDKHVREMSLAMRLVVKPPSVQLNQAHIEASLRQWVLKDQFKDTNPVLGSWAQHFTQVLGKATSPRIFKNTMQVIHDHLRNPYHLEMAFWMIRATLNHYSSKDAVTRMEADGNDL